MGKHPMLGQSKARVGDKPIGGRKPSLVHGRANNIGALMGCKASRTMVPRRRHQRSGTSKDVGKGISSLCAAWVPKDGRPWPGRGRAYRRAYGMCCMIANMGTVLRNGHIYMGHGQVNGRTKVRTWPRCYEVGNNTRKNFESLVGQWSSHCNGTRHACPQGAKCAEEMEPRG